MSLPDVFVFTNIVNSYLPEPNSTLVNGIVLGVGIKDSYELYNMVKTTGLLHIVVLSGMNITILAMLVSRITSRISKNLSLLLLTILIAFFVGIVNPQAPIIRAVIMCYVTIVAFVLQRSIKPIAGLFISAVAIGIIWPDWITSLSFLLSFFSTLGIIIFASDKNTPISQEGQLNEVVISDLKTSISAQIMTVPIIVIYFREISLIAPISTMLVSPFIAPLMLLTFITLALGSINWYLGLIPSLLAYGISEVIIFIIHTLSKIPFVYLKF